MCDRDYKLPPDDTEMLAKRIRSLERHCEELDRDLRLAEANIEQLLRPVPGGWVSVTELPWSPTSLVDRLWRGRSHHYANCEICGQATAGSRHCGPCASWNVETQNRLRGLDVNGEPV
jgi:hypothetical protein